MDPQFSERCSWNKGGWAWSSWLGLKLTRKKIDFPCQQPKTRHESRRRHHHRDLCPHSLNMAAVMALEWMKSEWKKKNFTTEEGSYHTEWNMSMCVCVGKAPWLNSFATCVSVVESGKSIVNVHPPNWYRGTYSGVKTAAGEHQPGSLRELGQVLWEVKLCGRPSSGIFRINELRYENLMNESFRSYKSDYIF